MTIPGVSRTCIYVAAGRAIGAREPDPMVRNPDDLAERLLGDANLFGVDHPTVRALGKPYDEAMSNPEVVNKPGLLPGRAYHPKLYLFDGAQNTGYVVGSANLTNSALMTNTEVVVAGKDDGLANPCVCHVLDSLLHEVLENQAVGVFVEDALIDGFPIVLN